MGMSKLDKTVALHPIRDMYRWRPSAFQNVPQTPKLPMPNSYPQRTMANNVDGALVTCNDLICQVMKKVIREM